jgi:hypothetical protein
MARGGSCGARAGGMLAPCLAPNRPESSSVGTEAHSWPSHCTPGTFRTGSPRAQRLRSCSPTRTAQPCLIVDSAGQLGSRCLARDSTYWRRRTPSAGSPPRSPHPSISRARSVRSPGRTKVRIAKRRPPLQRPPGTANYSRLVRVSRTTRSHPGADLHDRAATRLRSRHRKCHCEVPQARTLKKYRSYFTSRASGDIALQIIVRLRRRMDITYIVGQCPTQESCHF